MCDFINIWRAIDWNSVISAVTGGLIAGAFSLWAVDKAHKNDLTKEEQQERLLIKGFIQSVQTEIETLWETYQEGVGKELEGLVENQALLHFYPLTQQDYFTIYSGSSYLVGRVKNERLRKSIVETYTKARGLIDAYRLNNDMVRKYEELNLIKQQSGSSNLNDMIMLQIRVLVEYAPKILDQHNQTKKSMENLFSILKEEKVCDLEIQ